MRETITAAEANRAASRLVREVGRSFVVTAYGCRVLLSEDMQGGSTWRGVTIGNPFKPAHA